MRKVLRGYHGAALSHIAGGIRLFNQIQSSGSRMSSRFYASIQVFNHIFARLDNQASLITHDRPRNLLSTPISTTEEILASPMSVCFPTEPFTSMEDARIALDKVQNAFVRASSSELDPTLLVDYANVDSPHLNMRLASGYSKARLDQWWIVFDSFVQAHQSRFTIHDRKALHVLGISQAMIAINSSIDIQAVVKNELLWDEHFPAFKAIVEHARTFVELGETDSDVPTLTLEMEILYPLYFVASKCRDGRLRREAISLLDSRERQEGIWNSILTTFLAKRLVEIEEERLASLIEGDKTENGRVWDGCALMEDIKWNVRVKSVQVKWDAVNKRVMLSYHRVEVEDGGQGLVTVRAEVP